MPNTLECLLRYWSFILFLFSQDIFSGSTHLSDSSTLILERVDRHHAGIYQCAADNGVREPVSMDINLTILCEFCLMFNDTFVFLTHIEFIPLFFQKKKTTLHFLTDKKHFISFSWCFFRSIWFHWRRRR